MEAEATDSSKCGLPPSDGELVRLAQQGQRQAYDELIRRHQRRAMAVSYRLLGNTQDALEVTQDAFLKGFMSIASLRTPDAFVGWLMRIVSNLSLNFRRARKNRAQLPLDELVATGQEQATPGGDPLRGAEGTELGGKLQEAMGLLPEKQRLALIMFTIDQMPQKQVAEALECSVEAVKWHVFQGRKKLKEMLKEYL